MAKRAAGGHPPGQDKAFPGGSTSGSCPSGAFPPPLAFASQAASVLCRTHAACHFCPDSTRMEFNRPPNQMSPFDHRSFLGGPPMSLSMPNHHPVLAKQGSARMRGRPATQDHSDQLRTRMVRLTVNLPAELADRMRDAVYWTPGLTIAWFIASAIRTSLTELETIHRAPFPKRARQLRPGRPRLMGQSLKLRPRFTTSETCDLADSVSSVAPVSRSNHE